MRLFYHGKDGGPESPVEGYWLIEIKHLFSIVLLNFNKGGRESFHTHAFHALTWFIKGDMEETLQIEDDMGRTAWTYKPYKKSLIPKFTPRTLNHKVFAFEDSWCLSLRGPWSKTWTEDRHDGKYELSWGRGEVKL